MSHILTFLSIGLLGVHQLVQHETPLITDDQEVLKCFTTTRRERWCMWRRINKPPPPPPSISEGVVHTERSIGCGFLCNLSPRLPPRPPNPDPTVKHQAIIHSTLPLGGLSYLLCVLLTSCLCRSGADSNERQAVNRRRIQQINKEINKRSFSKTQFTHFLNLNVITWFLTGCFI